MRAEALGAALIDVVFVLPPAALLLDLAGPAETFRLANEHGSLRFALRFASPTPVVESSVGLALAGVEPLPLEFPRKTWIVLVGQPSMRLSERGKLRRQITDWLVDTVRPLLDGEGGHKLVTICSGGLVAGDAGLLGARRCTTHHDLLEALRIAAPSAEVIGDRVFVEDGEVCTSAGVTAGIDLALHLVAGELGAAVAAAVARDMVVYFRRGPNDPELSPFLAHRNHLHAAVHRVQDAVSADPRQDWSVRSMAVAGRVTPRHLGRLFLRHTGLTPLAFLRRVRLERAQKALASGASVTGAAESAGFSSDVALRRAWKDFADGSPRGAIRSSVSSSTP